ncbi:response regulator [Mangrovimicrobium sediminis]|uniref:Response regulator n=1 Tax=Mangrovimicrobium sediminis TaxID=2562682 RepID=A0A4Z0M925_9GAMM|nr:SpoIIE family protein phosphatase [Haliea sp. SAOS-164]TGD76019.1 response regulator [Haliea sp. SAOS-164]
MKPAGNVLVVDHDVTRAQLLAGLVEDVGFNAEINSDLATAARTLQSGSIDVVLCDMDMQGLNWDEARRASREAYSKVPVIFFSEGGEEERMMRALRFGASDFFVHPIDDSRALQRSIERCVGQREVLRELERSQHNLEALNTELRGTVKMLEQDQQAGRQVQLRMLPATPLVLGDYVFSHTVIPSLYLSGDFTDYFTVGDHFVTFFMADVSGHGSSSAFATVLLKNLFARKRSDFLRKGDDTILSPVGMLKRANHEIKELQVGKFATMVVGVLDIKNNTLRYSIAGHLPQPVLVCNEGARYLRGEGSAVGIMDDPSYEEHMIDMPASFMLALFSDGILEILPSKNLIEKERYFLQVFEHSASAPEDLVTRLGLDHVETAPDDIAALFISKRG